MRYGGNTSCVEVCTAAGTLIILDCGSGIRNLSNNLIHRTKGPTKGYVFVTHTHWDHIQGFPFFGPAFEPQNHFTVYGPGGSQQGLQAMLAAQMEYSYWPIGLEQFSAAMDYVNLEEGSLTVEEANVTAQYLNHPAVTLGYRIEASGVTVVYSTDHEPFSPQLYRSGDHDYGLAAMLHEGDRRHCRFLQGADLVIHDAQFTREEFDQRKGWGHSPFDYVIDLAIVAGVRQLALFHHDPERSDVDLDLLLEQCLRQVERRRARLDVFFASEGSLLEFASRQGTGEKRAAAPANSATKVFAGAATSRILIVDDDPHVSQLLALALEPDGYAMSFASTGEEALRHIRAEHPNLVLLDVGLPGKDGMVVLQEIRSDEHPTVRAIPMVLLTGNVGESVTARAFAAGATDFMTKPFSIAQVRARVRGWLSRKASAG